MHRAPWAASDDQLLALAKIAVSKYPDFGNVDGPAFYGSKGEWRADWLRQFKAAFRALGAMKRTDTPDRKRAPSHYIEACEAYLGAIGKSETLRFGPWMSALIGHGDICFSGVARHHEGVLIEVGLSEYVGREARDAWKRVLETGNVLHESAVRIPPAPRSNVQVLMVQPSVY